MIYRALSRGWLLACLAIAGPAMATQGDGPKVRSKAAADAARPATNYDAIAEANSASFFNVKARGELFVFVIDCSGSMSDGRLDRAKAELRRTLAALKSPRRFFVLFYSEDTYLMPGGVPRSYDGTAKIALERWLAAIDADGGTDPRGAMQTAIGLKPDAIFLLSDGEFPKTTPQAIALRNTGKIPIHCIDLGRGPGAPQLQAIAQQSGGEYAER